MGRLEFWVQNMLLAVLFLQTYWVTHKAASVIEVGTRQNSGKVQSWYGFSATYEIETRRYKDFKWQRILFRAIEHLC